jgi:hypothetical protein
MGSLFMTKLRICVAAAAIALVTGGAAACPTAVVHPETARLVQMGAGGQTAAKAYEASISQPETKCESRGGTLHVNLSFKLDAALAPGVEAKPVKAPYFVVVMYAGAIVAKEIFPVTLGFAPAVQKIAITEVVDKISLPSRRNAKPEYEILVGFQLTPEQVRAAKR